jgi:drug/metabolite transporter (DMT)-like permease
MAAGIILAYGTIIGGLDNVVRIIARDAGLWQFHATRGAIALPILVGVALIVGMRLKPVNPRAVVARSLIHGCAMLIYFGALAFLPVPQVAAGLFTAPIFVLLISRILYGRPIGPIQAVAVATGFLGAMLVLGPQAVQDASIVSLLPVAAGAMYAMGNIATRDWCGEETAGTLLFGFFAALMLFGLIGMAWLGFRPHIPAEGAAGFLLRGYVSPTQTFLGLSALQGVGSLVAIGLMIRAYQMANVVRVSVFEYVLLPTSAGWGWVIWNEVPTLTAIFGMGLIVVAGVLIAFAALPQPATGPIA